MVFGVFKSLFGRDSGRSALQPLYQAIVAEARQPVWYLDGAVPDTLDGRFDMIAAVTAIVMFRLEKEDQDGGDQGGRDAALLTEVLVADMDGQFRQEGMGDVVVGKHIGNMMAALGGRLQAYRAAIDDGDLADNLEDALRRNLHRGEACSDAAVHFTSGRLRKLHTALQNRPIDALMAGDLSSQ